MRRSTRQRLGTAGSAVLGLGALALDLALLRWGIEGGPHGLRLALGLAGAAVQAASLVGLIRWPLVAATGTLVGGLCLALAFPELASQGPFAAANIALCALAIRRPPRVSLWVLAAHLATVPALAYVDGGRLGFGVAALGPLLSWSWGELIRTRGARRQDLARRAVDSERARIARELHDVVAHNVSVIVIQAAAADDVFDLAPEQARAALRAIEASGRSALVELRRLLNTVRPDEPDEPGGLAGSRSPQPGLAELDALVASVRSAGLEVWLRREGEAVPVPAGVGLSAYRIVQEALTNTLKHARATRADVTVRYRSGAVEIDVRDDGTAGGDDLLPAGGGHGLVGMRERVALLGGTLEAAPMERGGFRVAASLPLAEPA